MTTIPLTITIKDFKYLKSITIPTPPITCTPPQVYNPVTGRCETPIVQPPQCTPPQVYNPVTGRCETPIVLPPQCTPPQVLNPVTGRCETPIVQPPAIQKKLSPCPPLGDILGDGLVGEDDKQAILDHMIGKITLTQDQLKRADILGDGRIDVGTVLHMAQFLANVRTTFNGCKKAPPPEPSGESRIVKILPEDQTRLPNANEGETINITTTVVCKAIDGSISKASAISYLIVDGAIYDKKPSENGLITFNWVATSVPTSIHTICVSVEPTSSCKSPGQDCKRITVSSNVLGIEDQLAKEKESASEQKRLLKEARSRLRSDIIEAEFPIPKPGEQPIIEPPISPPFEPIKPPIVPPEPAPILEYGDIQIIGLPRLLLPILPDLPIYVYIDDKNVGRIYELPKTVTNVAVGSHSVFVRGGNITSPIKTVYVLNDKTTTVTL